MKKKYFISVFIVLVSFYINYGQAAIYFEDFNGQNGKGAVGPIPTTDLFGVNWTIDVNLTILDEPNDWFRVQDDYFQGRDLDGDGIWLSPIIDISGFTAVQFSLDALQNGGTLDNNDFFITEYSINGGAWTLATNNGTLNDDFVDAVVSETNLLGNTLQIRVTMINGGGDGERHRFDNVLVEGTPPLTPVTLVNPNVVADLGYTQNDASINEDTFTILGSNLTADIVLTAPVNFEISTTSGGPFTNTITLPQIAGTINLTTIYVRLISGLVPNTYSGNLIATSTGVTPQNVSFLGEVTPAIADCSELLISEYHEGIGAEEKYIELYNPTGSSIDLANYRLASYINGNTIPRFLELSGTINPYGTFVLAGDLSTLCQNSDADLCTDSSVLNFNGNDIIALQTSVGTNIDVIGFIGDASVSFRNIGLIRNNDVAIPTIVYNASQWTTYPINDTSNLGIHASECLCPDTTIWAAGGWTNGIPTSSTAVIIDVNYTTGVGSPSFNACSLTVNGILTVSDGDFVEVENFVLVNNGGRITTNTQGSFVQRGDAEFAGRFKLAPTGNANVNKLTATLNTDLDYTYWSAPVNNITVIEGLTDANPGRRFTFNAANFVDTVGDGIDDDGNAWTLVNDTDMMLPGQGFASTHGAFFMPTQYLYEFEGEYNTGDITYPLFYNTSNFSNHWNLIGNPYPSAIDTGLFFGENTSVADQVIYMWSQVRPPDGANPGNEVLNFNQNDYITINAVSSAGNGTTAAPARQVPSGQSFFIASFATDNVLFTNNMRVSGTNVNDEFYRTSNQNTNDDGIERLWVNLSSDIGIYSQISVAYADIATDGFDGNAIDTFRNYAGNAGVLYSLDNQGDGFYVIQGKAKSSLGLDEVLKIGFGAYISTRETYTLDVVQVEGNFLENNTIYLRDNYEGIVHDLSASAYTFESDGGSFDDRFEIVFTSAILSLDDVINDKNSLTILELTDGNIQFTINNRNLTIDIVNIYDIQGRLVYSLKGDTSSEIYNLSNLQSSIYIAKVTLSNEQILTKKALKK